MDTMGKAPVVLVIMCAAWMVACGPRSNEAPADAGHATDMANLPDMAPERDLETISNTLECERDPDLIAQGAACLDDDNCPCGARCVLGKCSAECISNAQCEGANVCDVFGRCIAPGIASTIQPPRAEAGGMLRPRSTLVVAPANHPVPIVLEAEQRTRRVRIEGHGGAQVRCPDRDAFKQECVIEGMEMAPGESLSLEARRIPEEGMEEGAARLLIHTEQGSEAISLLYPAQAEASRIRSEQVLFEPLAGRYEGSIRLVASGAIDASGEGLGQPGVALSYDVSVSIWEGASDEWILEIQDPLDLLTQRDSLIGAIVATDSGWDVQIPRTPFIEGDVAGRVTSLLAETSRASFTPIGIGAAARISLTQRYLGSGSPHAPAVRWSLELERVSELSEGAPEVPEDADFILDPATALAQLTPWEAAFNELGSARFVTPGNSAAMLDEIDFIDQRRGVLDGAYTLPAGAYVPSLANAARGDSARRMMYAAMLPILKIGGDDLSALDSIWRADFGLGDDESISLASIAMNQPTSVFSGVGCAFSLRRLERSVGLSEPADEQAFGVEIDYEGALDIDLCDALVERVGCAVREVSPEFLSIDGLSYIDVSSGEGGGLGFSAMVYKVCDMPAHPTRAAELVLCMDEGADLPPEPEVWTRGDLERHLGFRVGFGDQLEPTTGDLRCEGATAPGIALPFDLQKEKSGREMLEVCLDETAALASAPPEVGAASPQLEFIDLYKQGECAHLSRTLTALALESRALRQREPLTEHTRYPLALTHRILSRWLALHAFYATQGTQMADVKTALELLDDTLTLPELEELFRASLQGWDLLAAPHVLHMLLAAPGDLLDQPDYRLLRHDLGVMTPSEQSDPLATVLLDTITRQSVLLRELFIQPGIAAEPFTRAREMMPRLLLAQAIAATHYRRTSNAHGGAFVWRDGYRRESARASGAVSQLVTVIRAAKGGENLLGISDQDLPLYFDTDAADGAERRFGAISDFILGRNAESDAIAPAAVAQAEASFTAARSAFLDVLDRRDRSERDERLFELRLEDIRNQHNSKLRELCGPVDYSLVDDPDFDPMTCAISTAPECQIDFDAWYREWTENDLQGRLCVARQVSAFAADGGDSDGEYTNAFVNDDVDTFARACFEVEGAEFVIEPCPDSAGECLFCEHSEEAPIPLAGKSLAVRMPDILSELGKAQMDTYRRVVSSCREEHPGMRLHVPLPQDPFEQPGCVNGEIGSVYLDIADATSALTAATAAFDQHLQAYDIAYRSCLLLQSATDDIKDKQSKHESRLRGLYIAKAALDASATAAGAVKECSATLSGASTTDPFSAITSTGSAIASCVAGGIEAGLTIASIGTQAKIDVVQVEHDREIAALEGDAQVKICFNDARHELVGMKVASIEVSRASFDIDRAHADASDTIGLAKNTWAAGHAYVKKFEARGISDPAGSLWVDEQVEAFSRDYKLARRATFLAVRAVEYEYQSSLAVRQEVFDARTPTELRQNVLEVLWQDANTRGINGNRPTEFDVVLSLRDEIWRVEDERDLPTELRPMTPEERFRTQVASERFAIYDEQTGRYLGQQIPFSLAPLGALGHDSGGVQIYAQNDCAERLWSLNVSMQGADLFRGSETTNVRVEVLKRNTFYSQWCGDPPDEAAPFQVASVRPHKNLFREPGLGADFGAASTSVEEDGFSRARIQAFFNVSRAEFEQPDYAAGQTEELAARGLYGEYALFLPAELISRDGAPGLVLNNLDDVLIRLDYVSVSSR